MSIQLRHRSLVRFCAGAALAATLTTLAACDHKPATPPLPTEAPPATSTMPAPPMPSASAASR